MAVVIDMEMPVRCNDCKLRQRDVYSVIVHDRCFITKKSVDPYTFGDLDRPENCPLVAVPVRMTPDLALLEAAGLEM